MLGPQRPSLEPSTGRKLVVQTGMSLEVVRGPRNTLGREIGRGRHEASAICAQSPGHQTRVASLGEAHYGVEALLDDIYDPIAEIEIQYHLGIGPHEGDESRHHQHAGQWQAEVDDVLCELHLSRRQLKDVSASTDNLISSALRLVDCGPWSTA